MRRLGKASKLEERRRKAVMSVESGQSGVEDAARSAKVTIRTMRRWLAEYRKHGDVGIAAKRVSGRTPKLTEKQKAKLVVFLSKGAEACGFETPLWTCRRIAELIERKFGVTYNFTYIARLLGRLGWSPQKPVRRAIERNEGEIERWAKVGWARIKKRPQLKTPR